MNGFTLLFKILSAYYVAEKSFQGELKGLEKLEGKQSVTSRTDSERKAIDEFYWHEKYKGIKVISNSFDYSELSKITTIFVSFS